MLLHRHIEYLLTRHDCVILPGIGALIVSEVEPTLDLERGIITPRRRQITFNSNVVTDDGLLSHSIARRQRIPYEEAKKILQADIRKMQSDLRKEGETSLGLTGRLFIDAEDHLRFQPSPRSIQDDILPDISLYRTPEPISELTTAEDQYESEHDNDSKYYIIRLNRRAVHAAAMIITILTVTLSLLVPINHDSQEKASVLPLPTLSLPQTEQNISQEADSIAIASPSDTTSIDTSNRNI